MKEFLISWKEAAPALGTLIALISMSVALTAFIYTRRANRRRATLDMVMKTLLDAETQRQYRKFREIVLRSQDPDDCFKIISLAEDDQRASEDRRALLQQLNVYELMALGIRRGLFDEALYKRWYHNQFMADYEGAQEFVQKMQETKASIYCEATALYAAWLKNGHPVSSPSRIKMAWWSLLQQNHKIDAARAMAKAR